MKLKDIKGLLPKRKSKDHYDHEPTKTDRQEIYHDLIIAQLGYKELELDLDKVRKEIGSFLERAGLEIAYPLADYKNAEEVITEIATALSKADIIRVKDDR